MSLDRFKNIDQVNGYTPTYGDTLNDGVISELKHLTNDDLDGNISTYYVGRSLKSNMERHIYANNNLLDSSYLNVIPYTNPRGPYPLITLRPEEDIRNSGYRQGAYNIVYNFLHKVNEDTVITGISADRTEVRIKARNGAFNQLKDLYFGETTFNTIGRIPNSTFVENRPDFVLNLSDNNIIDISSIYFDGNRIGLEQVEKTYPKPVGGFNNISTTYVPIDDKAETLGGWREFVEIYTPAIGETQKVIDDIGNLELAAGRMTGRWRKFSLYYDDDNQLQWNGAATFDISNDSNLPSRDEPRSITEVIRGRKLAVNLNNLYLTYKKYNTDFKKQATTDPTGQTILRDIDIKTMVVKLTQPLPTSFLENNRVDVDARIKESWIEKLVLFPSLQDVSRPDFAEPNYTMDMSDQKGADGVDWQNWNSLLDVNATTSQQLVNKYFSGSLGSVKLNIDYSDISNFVHFSSATERVDNFLYKVQQVENYNARISTLENVSGSDALTNISQSMIRRDTVIGGFDDFENHMYYSTRKNNYTHWSSSAFLIEPYPKSSTFPHILQPSTSDLAVSWYNGTYASASLYDEFNDSQLSKMIPIHLQNDIRNEEYTTFVDMIGQHFDIQWTYIKSLTDVNKREEHPKDGMPDDILKSVAESFGWKLANGYSDVNLWKYALGVESDGTKYQTGVMESKSREEIVNETWRRIVNTLPMLYKTKGTARSIKAILSTYGIPQSFLKIREWGGPAISSRKNTYESERFVNKLQASPSKYISNPWDDIQLDRPNTIEVIGKMPKGNYHVLRLSDGGDNVDYFWDYLNETARIRLNINGSDIISSSYVPYKTRREVVFGLTSGSININSAWVDDFGDVLANPTTTLNGSNTTFNSVWTSTGTLNVPGPTTDSNVNSYETASIQEIRYYRDGISNEIILEHAKNREAYFSDDNTTDLDIDTSFDKLMYRIFPDSTFNSNSSSISSIHPNQKFTTSDSGLVLSASLVNMKPSDLVGEVDTQFITVPSAGPLNLLNQKVRIESSSLVGSLNVDKSNEKSQYDYAPIDSNLLGTYFSTTDTVNSDIYNSEGYFEIDDWVGDPDKRYNESYPLLKYRAKNYFQKYTSGTAIDLIMDMLARYDMSVFSQIKQLLPARVQWKQGILIEPHILERNKYQRERAIEISRHMYDGTITMPTNEITASRNDYDVSAIDLYNFKASTYCFDIATLTSSIDNVYNQSQFVTGSTTIPTSSTTLKVGSTTYPISNVINSGLGYFELSSQTYLSQSTGVINYNTITSQPNVFVTASNKISTTTNTPVSSSNTIVLIDNFQNPASGLLMQDSDAQFSITGSGQLLPSIFIGPAVRIKGIYVPSSTREVFFNPNGGIDASIAPAIIEDMNNGIYRVNLIDDYEVNPNKTFIYTNDFNFDVFTESASISITHGNTNIVNRHTPSTWTDVDYSSLGGVISFDDGSGLKEWPILERVDGTTFRIDTSSVQAPNTSGSTVTTTTNYSSSNNVTLVVTTDNPIVLSTTTNTTYVNRKNGYWECSPTGSTILNARLSNIYQEPKYFFASKTDAETMTPNSTSFHYARVQDTRLPLSMENLYYNGCRITSDSLTTDSLDTPDGGPVVEITKVDPNVIVYSGQENDPIGTTQGPTAVSVRKMPEANLVSVVKASEKLLKSRPSVGLERATLKPLTFIPRNTKSKSRLRSKSIFNRLLRRFRG